MEEDDIGSQSPQKTIALEKKEEKEKKKNNLIAVIGVWLITNHSEPSEAFALLEAPVSITGQHYIRLRLDKLSQITYVSITIISFLFPVSSVYSVVYIHVHRTRQRYIKTGDYSMSLEERKSQSRLYHNAHLHTHTHTHINWCFSPSVSPD
jgi:hypothetical protein